MAAGKSYVWAVNGNATGADSAIVAQLTAVVEGCVAPDPSSRWSASRVLDTLTALQREVSTAGIGSHGSATSVAPADTALAGAGSHAVARPPVPGASADTTKPPARVYDVMAMVDAIEALGLDAAAVIDAVGGGVTAPLEVMTRAGMSFVNGRAVQKKLNDVVSSRPTVTEVRGLSCICSRVFSL